MMKAHFYTTAATITALHLVPAFANANAGSKFYVSEETADTVLDATSFEALTYVQVGSVGNLGEVGTTTNILTYDTWDTDVIQKGKGISDAGSPELEVARIISDPGQIIMRTAARTNNNRAFMIERNDAPEGGTPTIIYNRGLITGPRRPMGRNEDFDLEVYTLALQQREIVVDAAEAI